MDRVNGCIVPLGKFDPVFGCRFDVIVDTGLTAGVDTSVSIAWAVGYLLLVALLAVGVFYRRTRSER